MRLLSDDVRMVDLPEWQRQLKSKRLIAARNDKAAKLSMKERFEALRSKGQHKERVKVGDLVLYNSHDTSAGHKNRPGLERPV